MSDILHADSFLGTNGNFATDITLVLSLFIALLFTLGAWLARQQRYEWHRWLQTAGAGLNLVLVGWLMVIPFRDFVISDLANPVRPAFFYGVTIVHAIVGFSAVIFGLFVVLRGHNLMIKPLRFNNYKPYMRVAYGLYMLATLLGVIVYIIWFVLIPNPPLFE